MSKPDHPSKSENISESSTRALFIKNADDSSNGMNNIEVSFYKVLLGEYTASPIVIPATAIITIIISFAVFLVLLFLKAITFGSETKRAFWLEICSQTLNTMATIIALATFPIRIKTFKCALEIQKHFESIKNNNSSSEELSKNIKNIQSYSSWYNPEIFSSRILLTIMILFVINCFSTCGIAIFLWVFAAYDDAGHIVFPMITRIPRPNIIVYVLLGITLSSALCAGLIILVIRQRDYNQRLMKGKNGNDTGRELEEGRRETHGMK